MERNELQTIEQALNKDYCVSEYLFKDLKGKNIELYANHYAEYEFLKEFINKNIDGLSSKIEAIDNHYKLDLKNGIIKKSKSGTVLNASLSAWIKRNGYEKYVNSYYSVGKILGASTYLSTRNDLHESTLRDVFKTFLLSRQSKEKRHFIKNDTIEIKKTRVLEFVDNRMFDCVHGFREVGYYDENDVYHDFDEYQLDLIIEKCSSIEKYKNDILEQLEKSLY